MSPPISVTTLLSRAQQGFTTTPRCLAHKARVVGVARDIRRSPRLRSGFNLRLSIFDLQPVRRIRAERMQRELKPQIAVANPSRAGRGRRIDCRVQNLEREFSGFRHGFRTLARAVSVARVASQTTCGHPHARCRCVLAAFGDVTLEEPRDDRP